MNMLLTIIFQTKHEYTNRTFKLENKIGYDKLMVNYLLSIILISVTGRYLWQ